ncbi:MULTISPECIES: MFS transporter [unclassified Streptomyces]|uniref:MFS transporter n=1 Tax=unclassified Streptomyces TaxID=2593676 RepID=UPI0035E1521E
MAADSLSPAAPSETDRPPTRRRAWLMVAALLVFMLLNYADKAVVGLVGVDLLRDLDIDASEFGLVQSGFFWLYAAGAIIGGFLIGRIPARWLLGGVALLWVLCLLPMVWSTSFTVLLVSRMLLGFAEGPSAAMALGVAHSWFPAAKRTLPTSFVVAGASFGPLVAAPVITFVVARFDWHAAFVVTAVAGVVWVVVWLIVGRDGPEEVGHGGSTFAALPEHVPYRRLLTSGTVVGLTVLFFATYASVSIKVSWLPLTLRQGLGYDATTTGWLVALTYGSGGVLMILFGAVSRAMTKRGAGVRTSRGLLSCALVAMAGLCTILWPSLGRGPLQILLLVAGTSLCVGAQGVAWTLVSDVTPARQRGTVIGVMVSCYSMGGVIAPLVLGGLVDGASDPLAGYRLGFAGLGALLLVAALVAMWLVRPERDVEAFASAPRPVPGRKDTVDA